jgi:Fe-S oxidoreductase
MDIFYNHVNHACVRLLAAQNRMVENPPQTCCGALAYHAGESDITVDLAKKNILCFEQTEGPIAVSAAGCGAMLKEYGELLHADGEWAERAKKFSERVVDITECLADGTFTALPKQRPLKLPGRIAYHAACHLAHAQKVRGAPAALLNNLIANLEKMGATLEPQPGQAQVAQLQPHELAVAPAVAKNQSVPATVESTPEELAPVGASAAESPAVASPLAQASSGQSTPVELTPVPVLVPLHEAEHCCGSAGIYNILHPEMALAVLERKMDYIQQAGADLVVTTNPGCILQMQAGAKLRGLNVKVEHLCQLLDDIYCEKS